MRTIGQLIEDVQIEYNKGVASDDSRLSSPIYVYGKLTQVRNRLINQQSTSNQKVSQWVHQTLNCVELEVAPVHECPCLPPKGCTIYRTKHKLPNPLINLDKELISDVTSVTGDVVFNATSWTEKKYQKGRRYGNKNNDYFFRNGRLYVTRQTGASLITITGIWEDPLEAYAYPSLCDECEGPCIDCESPLDKVFPIDAHKVQTLVEMTSALIRESFSKAREDRTNNTADSPEQESK